MKGKFGKNYDPNIASKTKPSRSSSHQEKEAYLKGKFGDSYDPSKVGFKAKSNTPTTKGYQGKNYDPDYLKKKLGDKYDPSRAPKR